MFVNSFKINQDNLIKTLQFCQWGPLFLILSLTVLTIPSEAQTNNIEKPKYIEPSYQLPGSGPSNLVVVGTKVVVFDDAGIIVRLMIYDEELTLEEIKEFPDEFVDSEVVVEGNNLILKKNDGKKKVFNLGDKDNQESKYNVGVDGLSNKARKVKKGWELSVQDQLTQKSGRSKALSFKAIIPNLMSGSRLFERKILAIDDHTKTKTIFWEEATENDTQAFVGVFSQNGDLLRGARVPLESIEVVPDRYLGVLPNGKVVFLSVNKSATGPKFLTLVPNFQQTLDKYFKQRKRSQTKKKKGGIDFQLDSDVDNDFQKLVRELSDNNSLKKSQAGKALMKKKVSRDQVIACAKKYLTFKWTLTEKAYGRGKSNCNRKSSVWQRPDYLNNKVGKQITGIPYCWGCSDSIETFSKMVRQGQRLAGDSCTGRKSCPGFCIYKKGSKRGAVGVDCSGFVSRCWFMKYHTTSNMRKISKKIKKEDLKKGDALNWPPVGSKGGHIRLFVRFVDTSTGRKYEVIEATNKRGSIGRVIKKIYTASQLKKYTAIRYNNIIETDVASSKPETKPSKDPEPIDPSKSSIWKFNKSKFLLSKKNNIWTLKFYNVGGLLKNRVYVGDTLFKGVLKDGKLVGAMSLFYRSGKVNKACVVEISRTSSEIRFNLHKTIHNNDDAIEGYPACEKSIGRAKEDKFEFYYVRDLDPEEQQEETTQLDPPEEQGQNGASNLGAKFSCNKEKCLDRNLFFAAYKTYYKRLHPRKTFSDERVKALNQVFNYWDTSPEMKNPKHLAYIIATIYHESWHKLTPIRECKAKTDEAAVRCVKKLWQEKKAGPYWRRDRKTGHSYYGRGQIQLTLRNNYLRIGKKLGLGEQLLNKPDEALELEISAKNAVFGMFHGWFRADTRRRFCKQNCRSDCYGKCRLGLKHISFKNKRHWYWARDIIISGSSHASRVAKHAQAIQSFIDFIPKTELAKKLSIVISSVQPKGLREESRGGDQMFSITPLAPHSLKLTELSVDNNSGPRVKPLGPYENWKKLTKNKMARPLEIQAGKHRSDSSLDRIQPLAPQ